MVWWGGGVRGAVWEGSMRILANGGVGKTSDVLGRAHGGLPGCRQDTSDSSPRAHTSNSKSSIFHPVGENMPSAVEHTLKRRRRKYRMFLSI